MGHALTGNNDQRTRRNMGLAKDLTLQITSRLCFLHFQEQVGKLFCSDVAGAR
jgi:hypothetical protein